MTTTYPIPPADASQATLANVPGPSGSADAPPSSSGFAQSLAQAQAAPLPAANASNTPSSSTAQASSSTGFDTNAVGSRNAHAVQSKPAPATPTQAGLSSAASPKLASTAAQSAGSVSKTNPTADKAGATKGGSATPASQASPNQAQNPVAGTSPGAIDPSTTGTDAQGALATPSDPAQGTLAGILAAQAVSGPASPGPRVASANRDDSGDPAALGEASAATPSSRSRDAATLGLGTPDTRVHADPVTLASARTSADAVLAKAEAGATLSGTPVGAGDASVAPGTDATSPSSFAALLQTSTTGVAATSAPPASVASPVGTAAFDHEFSQGIVSLAHRGSQSVALNLNPEHLGPVRVDIQMSGQTASLTLTASHEATRSALSNALPQLHQMFTQSGLVLGHAQVGGESARGDQRAPDSHTGTGAGSSQTQTVRDGSAAPSIATPATVIRVPRLVDTFA